MGAEGDDDRKGWPTEAQIIWFVFLVIGEALFVVASNYLLGYY